ncbi:hypothetical protein Acsp06_49470 [Actinomycetospora sp. NBRC 106375]|uniref:hypothetical protein n=1 Tax=Actinomycetospora sp. NBRC 106375 TaxID=3032207 RepID=UPI0024A0046A|nr:hypothetical protein [Actinomycetospora sp. NBRC 106375]GLZ48762.1 hypothetical protein Acsp06_49470 [Actinomycetospora sp. NBRC 106375]
MSEQFVDPTEAAVENDTTDLGDEPSVVLDEDRLDADPLEDGMDAPEGYSRDVRLGGTQEWETEDATIDERLPQEEPDVGEEEAPGRPVAATPIDDLDESIDDPANAVDGVGGGAVLDAQGSDGVAADEQLAEAGREVELGLSSANGDAEPTGLPADDAIGEVAAIDREPGTAEEEALRVEQEN